MQRIEQLRLGVQKEDIRLNREVIEEEDCVEEPFDRRKIAQDGGCG